MEFTDAKYLVIWDESYLSDSHYAPFQVDYVAGAYLRSVKVKSIMMSEIEENKELISEYADDQIIVVGEINNWSKGSEIQPILTFGISVLYFS